jgi:hypothetical protein
VILAAKAVDTLNILGVSIDQQDVIITGIVISTLVIYSYRWGTRLKGKKYNQSKGDHRR